MRVEDGICWRRSAVLAAAPAVVAAAMLLAGGSVGAVSRDAECDDLDIAVEPAADFRTIECKAGQTGYGGETDRKKDEKPNSKYIKRSRH